MGHLGKPLADALSPRAQMKVQLGDGCEGELYQPREAAKGAVVILHERYGLVQHTLDLQPRAMGDMLRELQAPALFVYGERDHTISLDDVRQVRDALESARRSYRMKVFADMPHGFLNDTMPGRYRPTEAAQAWQLLLAFLAEVFAGQWSGRVRWEFEGITSADYDFAKNLRLE